MTPGTRQRTVTDDQGIALVLGDVTRVVSLVPSLTEAIAVTAPGLLVGATDWCTHPAGLDVARVRGTKNPDTARIVGLRPDLVVANEEENRAVDLEALRQAGVPVWLTEVRTVDQAFDSLERLLTVACGLPRPLWLDQARDAWAALPSLGELREPEDPGEPRGLGGHQRRAIVPIWRRPWMVLGRDTFAGDVLRRLGVVQLYADHAERYPAVPLEELRARPRRGPRRAPGRAVSVHRRRRPGGLPRHPGGFGEWPASDVVRTVVVRGPGHSGRPTGRSPLAIGRSTSAIFVRRAFNVSSRTAS
jgi:hypothetical protein